MDQTIETVADNSRKEFIRLINKHIDTHGKYTFRPIKIDSIDCYVVIYGETKIVNFESIHVYCKFERNGQNYNQPYSVYHFNYRTIEYALTKIEKIANSFKIFDGDLVSDDQYMMLQMEKMVIPYREQQCCCVCFNDTYDTTLDCNHYICLQCRCLCILNKKPDCPVCRKDNALKYYSNDMKLVNNCEYGDISRSMNNDNHPVEFERFVSRSRSSSESESRSLSPESRTLSLSDSRSESRSSSPPALIEIDLDTRSTTLDLDHPFQYHTPIAFMYWRRLLDRTD